jgi:hypothetical protein
LLIIKDPCFPWGGGGDAKGRTRRQVLKYLPWTNYNFAISTFDQSNSVAKIM